MSTNDLPLDAAALDRIESGELGVGPSIGDKLIAQARAALTLRARVAELEQRERDSDKAHACQVARVEILLREKAELEGELASERKRANDWMARVDSADHEGCAWMEHANALRDALKFTQKCTGCAMCSANATVALASTPAADLAAHDAEVLSGPGFKLALQVAGAVWAMCAPAEPMDSAACVAIVERALAAQAQEVTK